MRGVPICVKEPVILSLLLTYDTSVVLVTELEQNALPAHYQLDKKTLKKLPNEAARDLVKSLLMMNEKYRLGHKGCNQVMKHKFFDGIDWEGMKNGTAQPPSRPDCSRASVATGELDLMKLLNGEDEEEIANNLTAKEQGESKAFESGLGRVEVLFSTLPRSNTNRTLVLGSAL